MSARSSLGPSRPLRVEFRGEETIITRHGKPVARIVREGLVSEPKRVNNPGSPYHGMTFAELLMAFPGGIDLGRDQTPMREIDL
jgi:hypothetical protein